MPSSSWSLAMMSSHANPSSATSSCRRTHSWTPTTSWRSSKDKKTPASCGGPSKRRTSLASSKSSENLSQHKLKELQLRSLSKNKYWPKYLRTSWACYVGKRWQICQECVSTFHFLLLISISIDPRVVALNLSAQKMLPGLIKDREGGKDDAGIA